MQRPIETQDIRKRKLSGWFYVDISVALDERSDREEAFRFIPVDKTVRSFRGELELDLSTVELEYAAEMFPVNAIFDPDDWFDGYVEYWRYDKGYQQRRKAFRNGVQRQFDKYQVPVIELAKSTPRAAVCQVFEKVNTGGVTLTVFELLTATYATDEFDLRGDWESRKVDWAAQSYEVLREVSNTDFLQAVTLLSTTEQRATYLTSKSDDDRAPRVGCRRVDILNLPLKSYVRWAPEAVAGFKRAASLDIPR